MRRTLFLALAFLTSAVHAAGSPESWIWGDSYGLGGFDSEYDDAARNWKEIQTKMPPYPKADNLIPFVVSATTSNQYFVDLPSVTTASDGVVRYTVVIRSPAGAETVSYEGMHCDNGERKLYAFGHSDGKGGGEWSRNRFARWEPIKERQQNSYQRELFFHYFCTVEGHNDLKAIHRLLKSGGLYDRDAGGLFVR